MCRPRRGHTIIVMPIIGRLCTLAIPVLLLVYALARYADGRDGDYGPGLPWAAGHIAFLGAFLGFGLLTILLRIHLRSGAPVLREAATGAALLGVALFCWVILTDLLPGLDARAALPDPIMAMGPVLFIAGFVGLLALVARHRPAVPLLTPALTLIALVLVGANLDLLAVTAGLLLVAVWPLRRLHRAEPVNHPYVRRPAP